MSAGQRYPLEEAVKVADEIRKLLVPYVKRIQIAGSIRRRKPDVGDVEILAIPEWMEAIKAENLFGELEMISCLDHGVQKVIDMGFLKFRLNSKGAVTNGEQIKLLKHVESGIPVDIFVTGYKSWWNYLVCRTGPSKSNINICKKAKEFGLKWEPYSSGFLVVGTGERIHCESEQKVFETVEIPYRSAEFRV